MNASTQPLRRRRPRRRRAALVAVLALTGCASRAPVHEPSSPPALRADVARTSVAVPDFEGGSIPPTEDGRFWQRALALNLLADLRASAVVRIVDRSHLAEILREQKLSVSDLSDPGSQLRVGRIAGAQLFVFGTYTIVGGAAVLTARMTEVETGRILKSEKVSGDAGEMAKLSKQLAIVFLRDLDAQLAARESARMQETGGPPVEALRYYCAGLDLEDAGKLEEAVGMYTKALTLWPQYDEARERLEHASEAAVRR